MRALQTPPAERIAALRATSPAALELALLAAPAVRIEPELLRALRLALLPRHGPQIEAELWFSALVRSRNAAGIVFDAAVLPLLRAELQQRWQDDAQRKSLELARGVMAHVHRGLSPALALEEKVAWSAVGGNLEQLNDELAQAVKALLESDRPGLQAWAAQVQRRLPAESFHTEAGQVLRRLAAAGTTAPQLAARDAGDVLQTLPSVTLGLRRMGGRLELGALQPPARWAVSVPDTEPRLLELHWQGDDGTPSQRRVVLAAGMRAMFDVGWGDVCVVNALRQQFDVPVYGRWMGGAPRWQTITVQERDGALQMRLGEVVAQHRPAMVLSKLRALEFYVGASWPKTASEQLWPPELVRPAAAVTDSIIALDAATAVAPWELVSPSPAEVGGLPFGLRGRCVRQWLDMPSAPNASQFGAAACNVLSLIHLPELQTLSAHFSAAFSKHGYEVLSGNSANSGESILLLQQAPLCVAHICVANEPGLSASEFGPGDLASLRQVPALMVIHALQPGVQGALAWITNCLASGARTALVAGNSASPAESETFFDAFYAGLLQGCSVSEATWLARSETQRVHPDGDAWAAFQLWGDGDFRLPVPSSTPAVVTPAPPARTDAVLQAMQQLDRRYVAQPGLLRLRLEGDTPLLEEPQALHSAPPQPLLLLIHPLATNTLGAFKGLWSAEQRAAWQALQQFYGEHIYAFEHHALSRSPIDNALQLAQELPSGARLHLLTLSEGGLIGELLARGARAGGAGVFEDADLELVDAERATLQRLGSVLQFKRLQLERYVRVACPARGTPFIERAHRTFGKLSKALSLLGSIVGGGAYELLGSISDPQRVPGLAAMAPDAPLIRLLNRPNLQLGGDLSIIAGCFKPGSLMQRLAAPLMALFIGDDNDLMVPTASMFGGAPRSEGARYLLFQGSEINHFTYFERSDVVASIVERLTGTDTPGRWAALTQSGRGASPTLSHD